MQGNTITLSQPTVITIRTAVAAVTKTVSVIHATWTDNGTSVTATVDEIPRTKANPIVLWDATTSTTYAQIGNWTEAQAEAALIALL